MGFIVDTFQLGLFAGIVKDSARDASTAQHFAEQNLQIGEQPGLLAQFVGSHEQAKGEIVGALANVATALDAGGAALDRAVRMYTSTDRQTAERLDSTYPDPGGPPQLPPLPGIGTPNDPIAIMHGTFPATRLTPPKEPEEFQNPIKIVNDLGNMISPGYWTEQVLDATIHVNPVDELSQWMVGDWEQFAKAADTLNSLSWFCTDLSQDISANANAVLTHWRGAAADQAFQYFTSFATTIKGYADGLAALRDKYIEAAKGVWEFAESVKDIIQQIFDNVFWAAVAAAAGTVLSETVIGPAVLWSLAALQCAAIVRDWESITKLLMQIQNTVRMIHGGILTLVGDRGMFSSHPLPAAYHHPGA